MHRLARAWARDGGGGELKQISFRWNQQLVMAGLVPAIHVLVLARLKDVDVRDIGERKRRRSSNG